MCEVSKVRSVTLCDGNVMGTPGRRHDVRRWTAERDSLMRVISRCEQEPWAWQEHTDTPGIPRYALRLYGVLGATGAESICCVCGLGPGLCLWLWGHASMRVMVHVL